MQKLVLPVVKTSSIFMGLLQWPNVSFITDTGFMTVKMFLLNNLQC